MMSLFDYLGRAAGPDLGKQVFAESKAVKIKTEIREVNTKSYKGKVILYPKEFLDYFFIKYPVK